MQCTKIGGFTPSARTLAPYLVAVLAANGSTARVGAAPVVWQADPTPNAPFIPPIGDDPFGDSGFFGDPDHWVGGVVPVSTDSIRLDLAGPFDIVLDRDRTVRDMHVDGFDTRARIDLNNHFMNVTGNLVVDNVLFGFFPRLTIANTTPNLREFRSQNAVIGKGTVLQTVPALPGFGELIVDGLGVFRSAHWLNFGDAVLGELAGSKGFIVLRNGGTACINGHLSIGGQGTGNVAIETGSTFVCGSAVIGDGSTARMTDDAKWRLKGNLTTPGLTIGTGNAGSPPAILTMDNLAANGHPILFAEFGLKIGKNGTVLGLTRQQVAPNIFLAGVIKTDAINGKKVLNDGKVEFNGVDAQPAPINGGDGGVAGLPNPFVQAARLTIRGDYEQTTDGLLSVRIGKNDNGLGMNPNTIYAADQLHVIKDSVFGGGTATISGGKLEVLFDPIDLSPSDLTEDDHVTILYASEVILGQFQFAPIDLQNGLFLKAWYVNHYDQEGKLDGMKVVLSPHPNFPAPGVLALLGLAGIFTAKRRRY
jgi:hypothetical protein